MFGQDGAMGAFPNLARLVAEIDARPAAMRACALKNQHPFKNEFDDDSMRHLYPQIFAPDPD
jgi:GST-like protein